MSFQVKSSGQCQLRDKKTPILFNCFIANRLIVDHDHAVSLSKYHGKNMVKKCGP
jgi:hypothetical protein